MRIFSEYLRHVMYDAGNYALIISTSCVYIGKQRLACTHLHSVNNDHKFCIHCANASNKNGEFYIKVDCLCGAGTKWLERSVAKPATRV